MNRIKNILFYSWWLNFWIIVLIFVALWERPMLRIVGPMAFIAFMFYAFYAMLVTRPPLEPPVIPVPPVIKTKDPSSADTEIDEKKLANN